MGSLPDGGRADLGVRQPLPHALAEPGRETFGRGAQGVEGRHRVDVAVVEKGDEIEQRASGGDEVERHPFAVELSGDDLDCDTPAVAVHRLLPAAIGEQMMRRLESGLNLQAIPAHGRIVFGRNGGRNQALAAAPKVKAAAAPAARRRC